MRGYLCVVLLVLCGCDRAPPDLDQLGSAIINGSPDPGHPAVGLLLLKGSDGNFVGSCSATLVGKRTVLTASHCVTSDDLYMEHPPPYAVATSLVFTSAAFGAPTYPVASAHMRPEWDGSVSDPSEESSDIAVVRLEQEVPGVKPMILAAKPPTVGEAITIVGFGITSTADHEAGLTWGAKRQTTNAISKTTGSSFVYYAAGGGSICYGDSGGPTFAERGGQLYLIGVHAYWPNEAMQLSQDWCEVGGLDARVDTYYSWIEQLSEGDLAKPDVTPPQVAITSPTDGEVLDTDFVVEVTATDNEGIASVTLSLDGQEQPAVNAPPYRYPISALSPGSHVVKAVALDVSGLSASSTITATVRQEPDSGIAPSPTTPGPSAPTEGGVTEFYGGCALGPQPRRAAQWPLAGLLLLAAAVRLMRRRP